eukprot:5932742-Pyramimonas_sp.AAC.1
MSNIEEEEDVWEHLDEEVTPVQDVNHCLHLRGSYFCPQTVLALRGKGPESRSGRHVPPSQSLSSPPV